MGVQVTGSAKQLDPWIEAFKGAPDAVRATSRALAEEVLFLIAEGFNKQADPYGNAWADKVFDDGRAILTGSTSRLRNGWHVKAVSRSKITVAPAVNYAAFHQTGTGVHGPRHAPIVPRRASALVFNAGGQMRAFRSVKGAPPRRMVPTGSLPAEWASSLEEAAEEMLSHAFGATSGGPGGKRGKGGLNPIAIIKRALRETSGDK